MARGALGWWIALIVVLSPAALAQPADDGATNEPWVLEIQAGEVFRADGAQANLTGPGRIEVRGTLLMEGHPGAPSVLRDVAIILHSEGPHHIAHVRMQAPPGGAALRVAGALALSDVAIEGGDLGIVAHGDARLTIERARFADQGSAALTLADNASASIRRATFSGGAEGMYSTTRGTLEVQDSGFRTLRMQAAVRLEPGAATPRFVNNSFAAPADETASRCLVLDAIGAAEARLSLNRFRGCDVGLAAIGDDLRVHSDNDTFLANRLAISVDGAEVRLVRPIFGNNGQDYDRPVILEEATFITPAPPPTMATPAVEEAPQAPPAPAPGVDAGAVMLGITLLLLGLAAVGYLTRRRLAAWAAHVRARWLAPELREEARTRVRESMEGAAALSPDDVSRRAGLTPRLTGAILDEMAQEGAVEVRVNGGSVPRYRLTSPAPPPGAAPPDLAVPLKPQEARILQDMATYPGTAQSAVAQRLGLSRQALHYHVKKLEARGLVTKTAKGRETHCFVHPDALALLAAAREVPVDEGSAEPDEGVVASGDTHAGSAQRP